MASAPCSSSSLTTSRSAVVGRADQRRGAARIGRAAHVRRLEEQLHVRIGAALEEQLDDRQAVGLVRRIDRRASAVDPAAQVDRREQRRFSEDVPLIDVGAGQDQLLREVPVGIHDRHEQRRDAVGIRQVDVRACS